MNKVIELINNAETVAILGHESEDADSVGSCYAMCLALTAMGKKADCWFSDEIEPHIAFMGKNYTVYSGQEPPEYDLCLCIDCGDKKRIGARVAVFDKANHTACIDHHETNTGFTEADYIEPYAAAAAEILYKLFMKMGIDMTAEIAKNLYIGISADTGSFKYSSADGNTHRAAAELIDMGVDFAGLSKRIFDTKSKGYFSLYAYAINSLKFSKDGKIAILRLSENDFERFGTSESEASAIVALPSKTEGVKAGVYIRDRGSECKVSLRSSGDVDVARIAAEFGGGGHVCAAGYSVSPAEIDENTKSLIKRINEQL